MKAVSSDISGAEYALRRLERLRRLSAKDLRDVRRVESLIIDLGLYPCDALSLQEFPESLWPFCDQGLRIWQYPNQFARCLVRLSRYPIRSYLEIGVAQGGTLIAITEYLKRFSGPLKAFGVDPCPMSDLLRAYTKDKKRIHYIQDLSQNLSKHDRWDRARFDLVLIDGLHDESACWADFELVREKTNLILFHDITNDQVPGVEASWNRARSEHSGDFDFTEFTEQYPEVAKKTGRRFLGIGLAARKTWRA